MAKKLPEPECEIGYSGIQLEQFFGDKMKDFLRFMHGQTYALCDGRKYDYEAKAYVPSCGPHGAVYYASDVHTFIMGAPIWDW